MDLPDLSTLPPLQDFEDERIRRDLGLFTRAAWSSVEEGTPYLDNWHIDAICEHLMALYRRQIKRLIINIPPRCMKSTLASVMFPAWAWLNNPTLKLMTCSYEEALAVRDAAKSRKLFNTPFFQRLNRRMSGSDEEIFHVGATALNPKLKDLDTWYENDRGGYRLALGVKSGALGKGGDLISVDDPQSPQKAYSEVERLQALVWWDRTMSTRLNNMNEGLKLIVMQRLHAFDLTGHELAKEIGYTHLKLPMEFRPARRCVTVLGDAEWRDPRQAEGELLWQERFGKDVLAALRKDLGEAGWAAQEDQEPMPDGGTVFKLGWFKRYTQLPAFDQIAISVDSNAKETEDGSYAVIQAWGFKGPDSYLLEQWRERAELTVLCHAITDMISSCDAVNLHPTAFLVEDTANGPNVINYLAKTFAGVIPIKPGSKSKVERARAVSPDVEAGNVWIPSEAPWISQFLFELTHFPKAGTDDQVDALSQALSWRKLRDTAVDSARKKSRFLKWAAMGGV